GATAKAASTIPSTHPWYRSTHSSLTCAEARAGYNSVSRNHPGSILLIQNDFTLVKFGLILRMNLNMIPSSLFSGFVKKYYWIALEFSLRSVRCDLRDLALEAGTKI